MTHPALDCKDPRRVRRLSRLLAIACLALIGALPPAVALYWGLADSAELAVRAGLSVHALQGPMATWQRVAAAAISAVPLALMLAGVWEARRCFLLFSAGQVFTGDAVRRLRRFAAWMLASAVCAIAAGAAVSVVITLHLPPGMRQLALSVGSDHVFTLFFACMVWLLAAVIGEGQALVEENASFV